MFKGPQTFVCWCCVYASTEQSSKSNAAFGRYLDLLSDTLQARKVGRKTGVQRTGDYGVRLDMPRKFFLQNQDFRKHTVTRTATPYETANHVCVFSRELCTPANQHPSRTHTRPTSCLELVLTSEQPGAWVVYSNGVYISRMYPFLCAEWSSLR